ncbi:MAG: DNA primase [Candidatus Berkelbacteria bacterium Licking1014_7]|uniref:DNA primase n=1 Tax=Candidatus Berkelbacteria bacterium Licking1014_7 TaxID=2017147 RepID=A0A554LKT9_9BACT|nr:MAG: DNA primase [Candidatus Berkelbacteria bacterium Licking1014_7]
MTDLDLIKQKIDLIDFIGQYLELKKAGANYKALCPFHSEKTPSFMVSAEKQIWRCFGCNIGGDAITFLMKYENLEFYDALKILAQKTGVALKTKSGESSLAQKPDGKIKLYKINELASRAFHQILLKHSSAKIARDYLKKRGLTDQTIQNFQLGFAPKNRAWLTKLLIQRGFTDSEIATAGAPQKFFNRIIFPITDILGNTVGFTGRALTNKMMPKYLNTQETAIFYKSKILYGYHEARQAIKEKKVAILVEGQMDVIMSHQAGVKNIIASSGTALTTEHLKILSRIAPNIILAFDADQAGKKASRQVLALSQNFDFNIKLIRYPKGVKDPGELSKNPENWRKILKNSRYFVEWLLETNLEKIKGDPTIAQKKEIFRQILPELKIIQNPIEKNHWIHFLSIKLQIPEETIALALEKLAAQPLRRAQSQIKTPSETTTKSASSIDLLTGIFLKIPRLAKKYPALYNKLIQGYNKEGLAQLEFLVEKNYEGFADDDLEKEAESLISRLKIKKQEKIKSDFANQIAAAENQGDRKLVKNLLKKLQKKL